MSDSGADRSDRVGDMSGGEPSRKPAAGGPARRPYQKPTLRRLGLLRRLTQFTF